MKGWECPKCGRVYSPFTDKCPYCGPQRVEIGWPPVEPTPTSPKKDYYGDPPDPLGPWKRFQGPTCQDTNSQTTTIPTIIIYAE